MFSPHSLTRPGHPCRLKACGCPDRTARPCLHRRWARQVSRSLKISIPWTSLLRTVVRGRLLLALGVATTFLQCPSLRAESDPHESAAPAGSPRAPGNVTVDSNLQLFAAMCALHAAGFEAEVSATSLHPVRARLRGELLRQQGPAAEALRAFYREHLLSDTGATLSRYVSFALVAGPPPKFSYVLRHEELP